MARARPTRAQFQLVAPIALYDEGLRDAHVPERPLTVSEWAERYRILSPDEAEPGPWRNGRTPYLVEIMDCLSSEYAMERVVLMGGGQIGKTECGNNWIGYIIHHSPGRTLAVQPTLEMAKRNSKSRVDHLINSSPVLSERVSAPRSADGSNTTLSKEFPGGILVMTGANSPAGLRSIPARNLFLDEVDAYPGDVAGEGDPIAIAEERTVTFRGRRKIFLTSTPGIRGFSRIERVFEQSDRRYFFLPCPECDAMAWLDFSAIRWPKGRPEEAYYLCAACEAHVPHEEKTEMMEAGEWRATAPGDGNTAGFHLSSLYSPWVTWGEIALQFSAAGRDPTLLKPFINMKLAQTWKDDEGEPMDSEGLMARREEWGGGVPEGVGVITCGVDVQDDRLELEVVGWGRDEESWSLDYRILYGDPATQLLWNELQEFLLEGPFRIDASCVDTGGHHTLAAYRFCAQHDRRRVWAIKGVGGKKPIWPRRPSRANKGKVNLFSVGVDAAKECIHSRLRAIMEPGGGYCHFPMDRDAQFFDQLTAERIRVKYSRGFAIQYWWKPEGRRNEALDCRVYAYAALHGLLAMGLRLNYRCGQVAAQRQTLTRKPGEKPAPPPKTKRKVARSKYMD